MNCKCDLIDSEKSVITSELEKGKSTLEISKIIGKYHQTMKNLVEVPMKVQKRADKGHSSFVSKYFLLQFKCEAVNNLGLNSEELSGVLEKQLFPELLNVIF